MNKTIYKFLILLVRDISDPKNANYIVTQDVFEGGYGVVACKIHPKKKIVVVMTEWDYIGFVDYEKFYKID